MALSRELMGAAQQMLGRSPTAQELNDPEFMQRLVYAADQGNRGDAGMRDNLSWVDALMQSAPADMPAPNAAPTSMNTRRASSGKGDRLDAQEAPLPPARPRDLDAPERNSAPLPPRRPSDLGPSNEAAPVDEGGNSKSTGTSASGSGRSDNTPAATPAMKTDAAAGRVAVDPEMDVDVQDALTSYNELHPRDRYYDGVPDVNADVPARTGRESERAASNRTTAGRAMVDMEEGMPRSTWDANAPIEETYRDSVSSVQRDLRKVEQAGIDPSSLTWGQKLRMQTMGVDRWIAEQLDQQQRTNKRATDRRAREATDKSGR